MNAKLIVHIGLPKTGTTTLQKYYFPFVKNAIYHGVYQPRKEMHQSNSVLYKRLMDVSRGGGARLIGHC